MSHPIQPLCQAIKSIFGQLKPSVNGFSFLILTGKNEQGKKTLMRQSTLQHTVAEGEITTDIYYNQHGIIVALTESWLLQNKMLLQHVLKQLNQCHAYIKITGIILCVDVNTLIDLEPTVLANQIRPHNELLCRFGASLNYRLDVAIVLTKLDSIAGFSEFYQLEHAETLKQPLGFSLMESQDKHKLEKHFKELFGELTESLDQQVLNKIHPARGSLKRTLIREFPLQMASLRLGIQSLIASLPLKSLNVKSVFFTSAEQGGETTDQLNKKIKNEYALSVPDTFPLSNNYRPYFIEGAFLAFQNETKHYPLSQYFLSPKMRALCLSFGFFVLSFVAYYHFKSNHLLNQTEKEWRAFERFAHAPNQSMKALHHLSQATTSIETLSHHFMTPHAIDTLKSKLHHETSAHIHQVFLPTLMREMESTMQDDKASISGRYNALKAYLMLKEKEHFQSSFILDWYKTHGASAKKLALLRQVLTPPFKTVDINLHLVSDLRNYFNALPKDFFYYSLIKEKFPKTSREIDVKGFTLAAHQIPDYFTKAGFRQITQDIPKAADELAHDGWVLNDVVPSDIQTLITNAYSRDYVLFWKNFSQKSAPLRATNYHDMIQLTASLRESNAFKKLVQLMQEATSPELSTPMSSFNQQVANQFTDLNLMTHEAASPLTQTLNDMERFLTTIGLVNDGGKTAFNITKARFQGDKLKNPLSHLFNEASELPEPIASWIRQIASDTWSALILDTKHFINNEWRQTIYQEYASHIANRFPFNQLSEEEVNIDDFNQFFATNGHLNTFIESYIKPFLDTSQAQWQTKEMNHFIMPFSKQTIESIMHANVITNMFFRDNETSSHIEFSLQKSDLDPSVADLKLVLGQKSINDTHENTSLTRFTWPMSDAKLAIKTLDNKTFTLNETGVWAIFKLLQKVDVESDPKDNSQLAVLFEINGNSGRYLLKTQNAINPFTPGILNGFSLNEAIN